MSRRLSLLMILVLLAALVLPAAVSAEVVVTDDPQPETVRYSHRLIVELASPPLAKAPNVVGAAVGGGKLDVASPDAQAYVQKLQAEQQAFVTTLQQAIPGAKVAMIANETGKQVPASYQLLLNAVSIDAGPDADLKTLERQLLRLPNVKRVSRDYAQKPDLYKSIDLINAPAAWALLGGQQNAGKGIKIASIDGGIHKDAPMFNGAGYTYPPGYPKGDATATNGKIIVARTYFRTWDPPAPGDENAWPGENGTSHGVHTSSIMAGEQVTATFMGSAPVTLVGVAPKAYLMSYRVFYYSISGDGSFYNVEGIKALEDAVADGADVINNSWGAGPYTLGGQFDALDQALLNAVSAGVFVTMSAGNAGPGAATSDHPSNDYISVAASTSGGSFAAGTLDVTAPEPVPGTLKDLPYQTADFGPPIAPTTTFPAEAYVPAGVVAPGNENGCNPFPAGAFAGQAALIQRGACNFTVKVLNAQNAGATMVIIYNSVAGGEALMAMGGTEPAITIPSIFVRRSSGLALIDWYATHGAAARVQLTSIPFQIGNTPDVIANFSSRGPAVGNGLKPDIAAPGVNILAQGYDPLATGEARHLGFGEASGTSMAAPHVSGAAALLKQIHPNWSPGWIKSALMSTSKFREIYLENGSPAQPLQMGAGRLDLTHAANPGVILDPPSLSFGALPEGTTRTMTVTLTSVASTTETYTVRTVDTRDGFDNEKDLAGVSFNPMEITLAPGATAQLAITWNTGGAGGVGDQQGFITLDSANYDAHFPLWVRVAYPDNPDVGQVLVIDNDLSTLSASFTDYVGYYTQTLTNLGITHDVWDADQNFGSAMTVPDANFMAQYDAVILQTGNNYFGLGGATLTQQDLDALTEYANNGGAILAFGQDLSWVVGDTSFFWGATLGANREQDSINAETVSSTSAQLLNGVPQSPYRDMSFDISARGDGADNQIYIDELSPSCFDPDSDLPCPTIPLLQYGIRGNDVANGYVALATAERVSLERPGVSSNNQTMVFGFGLEGVNNDTGFDTREDLLGTALHWAWDEPTGSITVSNLIPGKVTLFEADITSQYGGEGVSFRWDFGDGTEFTNAYGNPEAGHTYEKPGRYTVRVEITNELGTTIIVSTDILVGYQFWLPIIARNSAM